MKLYQEKYPISDDAKYVVDYVYDNPSGENYYYQIVRLSDNAILYANPDKKHINEAIRDLHLDNVAWV